MGTRWLVSWCVVVTVLSGCSLGEPERTIVGPDADPAATDAGPAATVALPRPADSQQVTVVRIVDGDTLRVSATRDGAALDRGVETLVRLLEIDTPETKGRDLADECFAAESTRELARLLPVGSSAWVRADRELLDRYGRTLLYVWNVRGEFVNEAMVDGGFAEAVLFWPNDLHIDRMRAAERRARAERVGRWGSCPPTSD